MKKLKYIIPFACVLMILFYKFFVVIIPPHSAVKITKHTIGLFSGKQVITGDVILLENREDDNKWKVVFHSTEVFYKSGKVYSLSGLYSYAPGRNEKILKNDITFVVLFPYDNVTKQEMELIDNSVMAHTFVCLQQASGLINNDFYAGKLGYYPHLLKRFLNQTRGKVSDLRFTDVQISKILYADSTDEVTPQDIQEFALECNSFLVRSQTLDDSKAVKQLAVLNSGFGEMFNLFNNH